MSRHENNRVRRGAGDPWRRVDEQRGNRHFSKRDDRDYGYSGYYGDANSQEHLGTNRFGSGRPNQYQDNRNLDHDDNFINQQVGSGMERNIGRQESWGPEISNTRTKLSTYGLDTGSGFNRGLGNDHSGKGPRGWKRSDERIQEEVSEALYRSPKVDASDIEVSVKDAVVYLVGSVEDRRMKWEAEECVSDLAGVEDVQNQLRLKSSQQAREITGKAIDGQDKRGNLS